jgi:hypothetical protein
MRTLSPATLFLVAAASCASPVAAQTTAPSALPPVPPTTSLAPSTAPETPRAMSPAIAAHLAAQLPKFAPPKPTEAATSPAAPADVPETARPRNTIFRLPNYVVQEENPPAFKERHLLTPTGRLSLGLKRYPGLRFGSLPIFSNDGWALAMLEEDHRLERKAEMEDFVTLVSLPADRAKAKAEVQKAFLRSDW